MDDPPPDSRPAYAFDLADAIGGPLGMLETSLPGVAFVVVYAALGSTTRTAAIVAVGLAVALAIGRLLRRQTPRHAVSGLFGVAIAAFIAVRSGRAENFFLPGLFLNAVYGSAFVISILVRRPLVGVVISQLARLGDGWRTDRPRLQTFNRASWMWAGLFYLRIVIELPLYLAGAVLALGVARTATGLPLFALGLYVTWLMVRRHAAAAAPAGA
ncbi:MAG: DUF3159 domain-containing protein [Solirubrobacteraceae bacterium]